MINLGTVRPGSTIVVPFNTFDSNDPSASVTITGLAVTDIEVYKGTSMTQRASDSGYALIDTDGIDLDGVTGIHGVSIDLADNTTAGFWAAGSRYMVVIASITVDAATINFIPVIFEIGYPDAIINTTIATLSSQTSFTLTAGPAEDDALNGCVVCIHDVASAVQLGFAVVSDYTGSSKTVTLTAGVTFTAAATDNIAIYPPANTKWFGAVAQAGDGSNLTETGGDGAQLTEAGGTGDQLTALATQASVNTIDDFLDTEIAAILEDTGTTLPATLATIAGYIDTEIGTIVTAVGNIETDTQDIQSRIPAALTGAGNIKADALAINGSTTAAARIDRAGASEVLGTCDTGGTTTSIVASSLTPTSAVNDQFNGRIVIFAADTTTTALRGQATDITDYVHSTLTLTVTALTTAPSSGDTFVIV